MINFKIHSHKEFSELKTDRDNLLSQLKEMESKVDTAKDFPALQLERNNLFNDMQLSKEKQTLHDKVVTDLTDTHNKEISELKTNYEKTISDLNDKVKLESASSEAKAISTLSKIGISAEELPKINNKEDVTQILEQSRHLQGFELSEYFKNNKEAISLALSKVAKRK